MIENMISRSNEYLPLKIDEALWDATTFQIYGKNWSFVTLSAWRLSTDKKIICGCYDDNSYNSVKELKEVHIIKIELQERILKVDPVFVFSNGLRLEIFSTDTFEAWTFNIEQLGIYIATPNEPTCFDNQDTR